MAEVSEFVYKKNKKHGILGLVEEVIKFVTKNWLIILGVLIFIVVVCWTISKFLG